MSKIDKIFLGEETGENTTVATFTIDNDAKKAIEYLSVRNNFSKQEIFKLIIKNSMTNINLINIKTINNPVTHKVRIKRKYIKTLNDICSKNNINRDEYVSSSLIEQYDNVKSFLNAELGDIKIAHKEIISLNKKINKSIDTINQVKFLKNKFSEKITKVKESVNNIESKIKNFLDLNNEGLK